LGLEREGAEKSGLDAASQEGLEATLLGESSENLREKEMS
jgi:hypothetical protein